MSSFHLSHFSCRSDRLAQTSICSQIAGNGFFLTRLLSIFGVKSASGPNRFANMIHLVGTHDVYVSYFGVAERGA